MLDTTGEHAPLLIIGHRGASAQAPENSLTAFALALHQGADGIELDVHLTADGQIVVLHDDLVDATTDGHGPVEQMTLAQVRALRLRARGATAFTEERVPTLVEVLDTWGHGTSTINVEIKPTKSYALAAAVANAIKVQGATAAVLLSSFDRMALVYLQAKHPDLRRALLYPPSNLSGILTGLRGDLSWLTGALALGCEAVHPFWRLATPRVIERAHALDLDVNVWTVDDDKTLRKLDALGVDGIITNDPAHARAIVGQATAPVA